MFYKNLLHWLEEELTLELFCKEFPQAHEVELIDLERLVARLICTSDKWSKDLKGLQPTLGFLVGLPEEEVHKTFQEWIEKLNSKKGPLLLQKATDYDEEDPNDTGKIVYTISFVNGKACQTLSPQTWLNLQGVLQTTKVLNLDGSQPLVYIKGDREG